MAIKLVAADGHPIFLLGLTKLFSGQMEVDLAAYCRPTLTIADATRVLLRGGPQGGSLDDVAIENTVICGTDQVAVDSRACEFLGLRGDLVGHIMLAEESNLGLVDYKAAGYMELA